MLLEGALGVVVRSDLDEVVGADDAKVPDQERISRRDSDVELESFEHVLWRGGRMD